MAVALRSIAVLGALAGVLAGGLLLQRAGADESITVPTRAQVGGAFHVTIDIGPGSNPNSINLPCRGDIPVAILTTAEFDASTADPSTAIFAQALPTDSAMEDVDGDGDLDLVLYFKCQDVSIPTDAAEACLEGTTYQGEGIEGCDSVRIVSPARPGGGAAATPTATPAGRGAVAASTAAPAGGAAAGLTATPALAGAVFAPTPATTPSPVASAASIATATPASSPLALPPSGEDGDESTGGWPWLLPLLVGVAAALALVAGLIRLSRPRRS